MKSRTTSSSQRTLKASIAARFCDESRSVAPLLRCRHSLGAQAAFGASNGKLPVAPQLEVRVHQPRDDESVLRAHPVRRRRRRNPRQREVHLGRVDEGGRRRDDQRVQRGGQRQGGRDRRVRRRQGRVRGADQARTLEGDPGAGLQRRWSAGRREGADGVHRPGALRVGLLHGPKDRNARSRRATSHCSSPRRAR